MRIRLQWLCAIVVFFIAAAATAIDFRVEILAAVDSRASAISENGVIVGALENQPVMWTRDGQVIHLASLPGGRGWASSVNVHGQVAGGGFAAGANRQHAWLWNAPDDVRDLGTIGGDWTSGIKINDLGDVTGTGSTANLQIYHPFLWTADAGMTDLGFGGEAASVNNLRHVTGRRIMPDGSSQPFLWTPDGSVLTLGSLGGWLATGSDINENDAVVGSAYTESGISRPFIWTLAGGMRDLGTLGGIYCFAAGISNDQRVVGTGTTADDVMHAFYWTELTGILQLPCPPDNRCEALDVNSSGEIIGNIYHPDGTNWRAIKWIVETPTPQDQLGNLRSAVESLRSSGAIPKGLATSLTAKLDAAIAALARGQTEAVTNVLGAFINEVRAALRSNRMAQSAANDLVARAQNVIAALTGT